MMTSRSRKDDASASANDDTPPSVRHALLEATLALVYIGGFDGISLRSVSGEIGKSTTTIFQNFGGRQGLLDAALDHALAGEHLRHEAMLADIGALPTDAESMARLVAFYVRAADQSATARFCLEALLRIDRLTDAGSRLQQWMAMRESFWSRLSSALLPAQVSLLAGYTVMEQAFCIILRDELDYDQLLHMTALATCRGGIPADPKADIPVLTWARAKAFPAASEKVDERSPMDDLLTTVAQQIVSDGISDINLRRIATQAGVPPSLIIYHYGDFAAFMSAAICRAMTHELPSYLDIASSADRDAREGWLSGLETAVDPAATDGAKGFYLRYARILGQVCLLARQRQELVPLVRQLRAIEGMGIHSASLKVWPYQFRLDPAAASAFSIWIKAHALFRIVDSVADQPVFDMVAVLEALTGSATPEI